MQNIGQFLPEKEKVLLQNIEELLDFINRELSNCPLDYRNIRGKKKFLYLAYGDLFTKASGALTLLKESRTIACNIVLRSIIEVYINIEYVFADRSDNNLLQLYIDDSIELKKLGNKISSFFHRNPDHKFFTDTDERNSTAYWNNFVMNVNSDIEKTKKIKRKEAIKPLPHLIDRAIYIDKVRSTKIEWLYITLYWLFSLDAHGTVRGLDGHLIRREDGLFFELEGDINDIEKEAVMIFMVLYLISEKFFDKFALDKTNLKPFKRIFISHSK